MTCNEPFFYWQSCVPSHFPSVDNKLTTYSGAPEGTPSIISRLVTADYYQRQCGLFFPDDGCYTFASKRGKTAEDLNAQTEGWNLTNTTRLLWVNG